MCTCYLTGLSGYHENYSEINESLEDDAIRRNMSSSMKDVNKFILKYKEITNIIIVHNYFIFKSKETVVITNLKGHELWTSLSSDFTFDSSKSDTTLIFFKKCSNSNSYVFEEVYLSNGTLKKVYDLNQALEIVENNLLLSIGKSFSLLSDGHKLYKVIFTSGSCNISSIKVPPSIISIKSISCGYAHAAVLSTNNKVFTIGDGGRGQLGNGSTDYSNTLIELEIFDPLKIIDVKAGGWHNLVLSDSGDLYAWGWNESGQVGVTCNSNNDLETELPDTNKSTKDDYPSLVFLPTLLQTPIDIEFQSINAGSRHSVAVSKNGSLFTWGWNGYQQLFLHEHLPNIFEPKKADFENDFYVDFAVCGSWSILAVQKNDNEDSNKNNNFNDSS